MSINIKTSSFINFKLFKQEETLNLDESVQKLFAGISNLCIVYFLHRGAGDENKSEAEKNKVVSIMAPHRMGEYSPLSRAHIQAHKITF